MNYVNLFQKIRSIVNGTELKADIGRLTASELPQTYRSKVNSAAMAARMAAAAGLTVENYKFPMDGKTSFQDKYMPYAWEATVGRLTVVKSPIPFDEPVIADYARHPFHLIQGSPALKEGGEYYKLISYEQLVRGADPENAIVLLPPDSRPNNRELKNVLELGAAGVVSDFLMDRYLSPDGIAWANGNTTSGRWNFSSVDDSYLGYCVSPRCGDLLRKALRHGEVVVKAECDGRIFEGELPAVSALIKGRRQEEVWLMAHLYEPMASDNSTGVCVAIAVAKALKNLIATGMIPAPEYTLRLVFAMELHGFAAMRDKLADKTVLGALNLDGLPVREDVPDMHIYMSPPPLASAGNALMRETVDRLKSRLPWNITEMAFGSFQDDQAVSDPTVGVPTIWTLVHKSPHWHNSVLTVDMLSEELLRDCTAFAGCWTAAMLSGASVDGHALGQLYVKTLRELAAAVPGGGNIGSMSHVIYNPKQDNTLRHETGSRGDFIARVTYIRQMLAAELEELGLVEEHELLEQEEELLIAECCLPEKNVGKVQCRWYDGSKDTVITRKTVGMPYDMCRSEGKAPAMATIYSMTGRVLAGSDGKKDLQQLIREGEYQTNIVMSETQIKELYRDLFQLRKYGYIDMEIPNAVSGDDFRNALKSAGIGSGDLLMVHSELSNFGPMDLTPGDINDILLETAGPEGTVLMPAFTRPYIYFEGSSESMQNFRPFSEDAVPYTGSLVRDMLKRPGCRRDAHTTHTLAGMGKDAETLLSRQEPFAPPTGVLSAWHDLASRGGKLVYLGSGVGCTTYLHYLETVLELGYLGGALIRYRNGKGHLESAFIPSHLGGCRDFYTGIKSKFFKRATAKGLKVDFVPLGYAGIHIIDASQLYEIGTALLKEDPDLLLCDDKKCIFCKNARRRLKD